MREAALTASHSRKRKREAKVKSGLIGFGVIAQLGEHLLCKQGVVGSIPTGSRGYCGLFFKKMKLTK